MEPDCFPVAWNGGGEVNEDEGNIEGGVKRKEWGLGCFGC